MRLLALLLVFALAGCQSMRAAGPSAKADLQPTKGNKAQGTATFTQMGDRVRVVANVSGLNAGQEHGFHIHEFGDCSAPDATSAGGHYNPEGHMHAGPETSRRHAGDLGNLDTDASGKARKEMVLENISLGPTGNNVIGRAVIVHAKKDDLKTQPTVDAGGRVACGVIGVAKDGVLKRAAR